MITKVAVPKDAGLIYLAFPLIMPICQKTIETKTAMSMVCLMRH